MKTTKLQGLSFLSAALLIFGFAANAAPNPKSRAEVDVEWVTPGEVHIVSSKDISYVVIMFCDGTMTKLEKFRTPELVLSMDGIQAVSVKSGTTRTDPRLNPFGCGGGGTSSR